MEMDKFTFGYGQADSLTECFGAVDKPGHLIKRYTRYLVFGVLHGRVGPICVAHWPNIEGHLEAIRREFPDEISREDVQRAAQKVKSEFTKLVEVEKEYEEINGPKTWPGSGGKVATAAH